MLSNVFGLDKSGAPSTPPTVGIFAYSLGISGPEAGTRIGYNTLTGSGTAIEQRFGAATIQFNSIFGAGTGILTKGSSVGQGDELNSNRVIEPSGNGILIENDSNLVIGNEVEKAGQAGILVKYADPFVVGTTGNRIGGEEESEENKLLFNGGPAIEIKDLEETNNEVARNLGEGNTNAFIDLVPAQLSEPNGPNDGIKPPTIATARESGAEGTAEPGAKVRVFRKGSSEPGELQSISRRSDCRTGRKMDADLSRLDPGRHDRRRHADQCRRRDLGAGTCDHGVRRRPKKEKTGGGGKEGGGGSKPKGNGKGKAKGQGKDRTPPDTRITKGPPKRTHKRTAVFKFVSTEAGSTFQCKLDRKPFKGCRSPKKYKRLKPGKHVFKTRAIDAAGNVDPTPAVRRFKVLK